MRKYAQQRAERHAEVRGPERTEGTMGSPVTSATNSSVERSGKRARNVARLMARKDSLSAIAALTRSAGSCFRIARRTTAAASGVVSLSIMFNLLREAHQPKPRNRGSVFAHSRCR